MMLRIFPALFLFCASFCALVSVRGVEDGLLPDDGVPEIIRVGAGSYASRPPRDQNKRPWLPGKEGWGDDSQVYSRMRLYVSPERKGPVPSTDWWTGLVSRRWSTELWAYPAMLKATPGGVELNFPKTWEVSADGKTAALASASRLTISAHDFQPLYAEAEDWSDWLVRARLPDARGRSLRFTMVHGMPFSYFEFDRLAPRIAASDKAVFFGPGANATADRLGIQVGADCYGLYAPSGTTFKRSGGAVEIEFPSGSGYLSIATLPRREALDTFAPYAPVIPRKTTVSWNYDPAKATVETLWRIESEDLGGQGRSEVLQGWLPHHYNAPSKPGFTPGEITYVTPRGLLRCAAGSSFGITFPFPGLLPEYPVPTLETGKDALRPDLLRKLVRDHLQRPGYGSETYWGGKLVLLHARYMEMARQLGMDAEMRVFRDRAAEAVRDWLTFEPGEGEHFFAWYPNWGSFVGCRSRDNANPGVDILQDHHMCYGYHVYAAALIMLQDPAFAADWGPMARLVAKDYAEWDADSELFGRFRNLDPWCGHSWSGGMGSDQGNGQESSSEAMQGYGAMFLLGEALGDSAMRDAAAFCWALEARGIAEYYFDRGRRNFPPEWPHTMVTNVHTEGLGFWTWFSGNPFWMHAIQWLPMSPLLCYLNEDPEYAAADFAQMWKTHEGGEGWRGYLGNEAGVCNITLNYLACFDADQAAKVFHELTDRGAGGTTGAEAGPTYWRTQALRELGPQRFDLWTDVATSQVFGRPGGAISWVVFNATDAPRTVRCFEKGREVATFTAPARRLSVMRDGTVSSGPGAMEPVPPLAALAAEAPLSEGCEAEASSRQGGDTGPENAVDGNSATRWSSGSTDGEWISVDLGEVCTLEKIVLQWEAAFGRDYDLLGSLDGKEWATLAQVRGGDGGRDESPVSGQARYVKMQGIKRGTDWGYSLFNLNVFGTRPQNPAGRLIIEPALAQLGERQTVRFAAFSEDDAGKRTPVEAQWQVRGKGNIAADGTFTPDGGGNFDKPRTEIIALAQGMRARAAAVVEEARRVGRIELAPNAGGSALALGVGERLPVEATAHDQFGAWIDIAPEISVEGSLKLEGGAVITTGLGRGVIRAELGGVRAQQEIEVVAANKVNLAAGRAASASSVEGGHTPEKAVDRDPQSRWASASADQQWLAVDLGQVQPLGRVVLRWEAAHARSYRIEVSDDGGKWRKVYERSDCPGGVEEIALPAGVKGRFVRVYGLSRATGYGYSLFEVEVYRP